MFVINHYPYLYAILFQKNFSVIGLINTKGGVLQYTLAYKMSIAHIVAPSP